MLFICGHPASFSRVSLSQCFGANWRSRLTLRTSLFYRVPPNWVAKMVAGKRAMPRWRPMTPEGEAAWYRRQDEGVAKYGMTFTRPRLQGGRSAHPSLGHVTSTAQDCCALLPVFFEASVDDLVDKGGRPDHSDGIDAHEFVGRAGCYGDLTRAHVCAVGSEDHR